MAYQIKWLYLFTVVLFVETTNAALPWWKVTNMYQVYPRSFMDYDGDGIGDLKGLIQKIHYLKHLGVETVWLSPIQTSPMVDCGYDISNYKDIDKIYGTMDDFKVLMATLQKHRMKMVVDFVVNHSSDKHPWFIKSVAKEDPFTDFYVWHNGKIDPDTGKRIPPSNWMSEFGGSVWEWNKIRQQYYLHDFAKEQPNFNFRSPQLVEEIEDVIKFWLNIGVDGFRMDSAKYLFKKDYLEDEPPVHGTSGKVWEDQIHTCTQNQPETRELIEKWSQIFYEYSNRPGGKPRALFLEIYDNVERIVSYYGKGTASLMQPFNFELLTKGHLAIRANEIKNIIDSWMELLPKGAATIWVAGNHDRPRVADTYGPEMVDAINMLTGVLPGVKVTYYGEEIGMQGTYIRLDQNVDPMGYFNTRDPSRTPMQWDDTISAGFSRNRNTWLPVNPNYWWLNVAAQKHAPSSHLKVFKAILRERKDLIMQKGGLKVYAPDKDTLVVVRDYNKSYFVLVINMGSETTTYTSENLFASMELDFDMQVSVVSTNFFGHQVGDVLQSQFLLFEMRPKSAILLRSPPSPGSKSSRFSSIRPKIINFINVIRPTNQLRKDDKSF